MIAIEDKREQALLILSCANTGVIADHFETTAQPVIVTDNFAHVHITTPKDTVTVKTTENESATLFLYDGPDVVWSGQVVGENQIAIPVPSNISTFKVVLKIV